MLGIFEVPWVSAPVTFAVLERAEGMVVSVFLIRVTDEGDSFSLLAPEAPMKGLEGRLSVSTKVEPKMLVVGDGMNTVVWLISEAVEGRIVETTPLDLVMIDPVGDKRAVSVESDDAEGKIVTS